jgi:sucrose phosphorylase
VGYSVKTPGTSCFMTPETHAFVGELAGEARERGLEVLVEVHSHIDDQIEIARDVDRVYDFALPPLLLHAFVAGTADRLLEWLRIRPDNAVTVLDTHDGIGVVDVAAEPGRPGLLADDDIAALVATLHAA